MTDEFMMDLIKADPEKFRAMLDQAVEIRTAVPQDKQDAPSTDDAVAPEVTPLPDERRETIPAASTTAQRPIYGMSRKETSQSWRLGPSKSTKRI